MKTNRHPYSMSKLDREDDEGDAQLIRTTVSNAVAEALQNIQAPNGGIVVIQNLTISIGSINSARGGGASVTVNQIQVDRPETVLEGRNTSPSTSLGLAKRFLNRD